jgi:tyrosinase
VDWNISSSDLAISVRASANALYNPYAGNKTTTGKPGTIASRRADVAQNFGHVTFEMAKELGVNNLEMQWLINVQLQRFAFPTAFAIHFFIGDPPADPSSWPAAPNLIGSHGQFITANLSLLYPEGFPAGLQQGEISLTHTLAAGIARGLLADLKPTSVVPLLAQNLNWRARAADGGEIDVEALADLSIAVGSRQVQLAATDNEFPTYGETQYHVEATQGKCGGVGRALRNKKP